MTDDFTRPAGNPQALGQEPGTPGRPPVGPPPVTPPPPAGAPAPVSNRPVEGGDSGGAKDAAKQEASKVAGSAKEEASKVAGTAREEVQHTVGQAKRQAQDLLRQSQSELSSQAGSQQERLASGLRSFSTEINQMAEGKAPEEPGVATNVARWASQVADDAGRWLEDRDPSAVLDEVKRYARRSPGTFMLIAGGLGLAVGRVARSLKDSSDDDDRSGAPRGDFAGAPAYGTRTMSGTTGVSPVGDATGGAPLGGPPGSPPPGMTYGPGGTEQAGPR